jgi:hypothetical protein
MKKAFLIIFLICMGGSAVYAQKTHQTISLKNYTKIPDTLYSRENLAKYVIPDKNYTYWELDEGESDTTKSGTVLFSRGAKPTGIVIKDPRGSLFMGCLPAFCYKYIAYVYEGKLGYITNNKDFITFMGKIDNVQEAILLAGILEDVYPGDKKIGGAYLITKTGFQLLLTKWNLCPEYQQTIQVDVGPNGITRRMKRKIYYKPGGCAMI